MKGKKDHGKLGFTRKKPQKSLYSMVEQEPSHPVKSQE